MLPCQLFSNRRELRVLSSFCGDMESRSYQFTDANQFNFAEYGYTYKVNEKSDVYSFGVVLMELVTGKRPIEPDYGDNKDIVNWVSTKLNNKEAVLSIVDSTISEVHREDAIKVLRIAILCTSRLPSTRPTMRRVVQMLEEAEPCKFIGIMIDKVGGSKREQIKDSDGDDA